MNRSFLGLGSFFLCNCTRYADVHNELKVQNDVYPHPVVGTVYYQAPCLSKIMLLASYVLVKTRQPKLGSFHHMLNLIPPAGIAT